MSEPRAPQQRACRLRSFVHATAALLLVTVTVAAFAAAVPGAPSELREGFAFSLEEGHGGSLSEALTYFATNARVIAALLVAAWVRPRITAGVLLDAAAAAVVGINVVVVGLALGAYGFHAIPWLVHLPFEWAALGAASTAIAASRRRRLSTAALGGIAGSAGLLLAVAASMEAWATP